MYGKMYKVYNISNLYNKIVFSITHTSQIQINVSIPCPNFIGTYKEGGFIAFTTLEISENVRNFFLLFT